MTEFKQVFQALASIPGIGKQTLKRLCWWQKQQQLSWGELWAQLPVEILTEQQQHSWRNFHHSYSVASWASWLASNQISTILPSEHRYPELLKHCLDRPELLFAYGNLVALNRDRFKIPISVVGTRKMTAYGAMVTESFVEQFAVTKPTIISGFMTGIDTQAHLAAQKFGLDSIGILGYGIDQVFPKILTSWRQKFIEKGGLFLSEYPPGTPPQKGLFRLRNRLVAGSSWATVITEAGYPSGTFITAHYAAEYGRLVAVVPTPKNHPLHQGTQKLLEEGAFFANNIEEFWNELKPLLLVNNSEKVGSIKIKTDYRVNKLISKLMKEGQTTYQLIKNEHINSDQMVAILLELEQQKCVCRVANRWYFNPLLESVISSSAGWRVKDLAI